jgi:hypothetical protein
MLKMVPYATLVKERRSALMLQEGVPTQAPEWNYEKLLTIAETNWVLRMVYDAIIREALSPGWRKDPKFVKKCTNSDCGKNFQTSVEVCDACNNPVRDPDPSQAKKFQALLDDPNPDNELDAILKSLMWQALAVDDWFLSINYGTAKVQMDTALGQPVKVRVAKEIWVEDSAYMKIAADKRGRLGNDEWFCPNCYNTSQGDNHYGPDQKYCPTCMGQLVQTAYVQEMNGQIKARFARDEMIHGNNGKNLPRLFGKPKLIALIRALMTMQYMDRYNLAAYSSGNLKSIIAFPESDQAAIDELKARIESELETFKTDAETGERVRPNRSLWLGTKQAPSLLNTLPPSKEMQSLEWYKFYREAVAAVYSVTPVFVSIIESGRAGNNPRMQIDVQNRATIEWQQSFEQPINNQVLPAFGITDWQFKFNEVEPEDEERDSRIQLTRAQAANIYAAAGFEVKLDDQGELQVSGEAKRAVVGEAALGGETKPVGDLPSIEAPGNLSQGLPRNLASKMKKKRYIVDEFG